MSHKAKCQICHSYFKISLLRSTLCGHVYCIADMNKLKAQRDPKCALCRRTIQTHEGETEIRFEFEDDSVQARVHMAKNVLGVLGMGSRSESVGGVAESIKGLAAGGGDLNLLLEAALDLTERIVPMMKTNEVQAARLEELEEAQRGAASTTALERQTRERLEVELTQLRDVETKRKQAQKRGDSYKGKYQAATAAIAAEVRARGEDEAAYVKIGEGLRGVIHELEEGVKRLEAELEKGRKETHLLKEKLKALRRKSQASSIRPPKHTSSTIDDSLQVVENSLEIEEETEKEPTPSQEDMLPPPSPPRKRPRSPGKFHPESLLIPTPPRTLKPAGSLTLNHGREKLKPPSNAIASSSLATLKLPSTSAQMGRKPVSKAPLIPGNPFSRTSGPSNDLHDIVGPGRGNLNRAPMGGEFGVPFEVPDRVRRAQKEGVGKKTFSKGEKEITEALCRGPGVKKRKLNGTDSGKGLQ